MDLVRNNLKKEKLFKVKNVGYKGVELLNVLFNCLIGSVFGGKLCKDEVNGKLIIDENRPLEIY